LEIAAKALADHYAALETFVTDPASPAILSKFLLDFSDAIEHDDTSYDMADRLCADDRPRQLSERTLTLCRRLDEIRLSRHDLVNCFDLVLGSGITAMFLRSDRTASMFEQASMRFTSNPGREILFAAKTIGFGVSAADVFEPSAMADAFA